MWKKVNPDLVARDEQGKPYTVRYEAVNAMLLNEFLKEHHKVEALEGTVAKHRKWLQRNRRRRSHSSKSKLKHLLRAWRK
jgi:hypothetical protein